MGGWGNGPAKGSALRGEMRVAIERVGRVKGKKRKNLSQFSGFLLQFWKVAAAGENAPDPFVSFVSPRAGGPSCTKWRISGTK